MDSTALSDIRAMILARQNQRRAVKGHPPLPDTKEYQNPYWDKK